MLENQTKGNENMNRYNLPMSPGKQYSTDPATLHEVQLLKQQNREYACEVAQLRTELEVQTIN